MIKQTKGKIFLAGERGVTVTTGFQSLQTFNYDNFFNEHKRPFGTVTAVNDDWLDAGCSHTCQTGECSYVVLLPVAGAIAIKCSSGRHEIIAAGQVFIFSAGAGTAIEIRNPFKQGGVNFLQLLVRRGPGQENSFSNVVTYDVNRKMGALSHLLPGAMDPSGLPFQISVGKFAGRDETNYRLQKPGSGLFVFVIEGAFEVEGRLLHARDGLALWNIDEAEMEALSNDAIILVIEVPLC